MQILLPTLSAAAAYARWVLVGGLVLGLLFQDLAAYTRPSIPVFIWLLLFVASVRIGPHGLLSAVADLRTHLWLTLAMQGAIPVLLMLPIVLAGWNGFWVSAVLLVAAASPISGSPSLVIMLGHDPAIALRQLVVGTALLPLTLLPVLFYLPEIHDVFAVLQASLKLLMVILSAAVVGCLLRLLPRWRHLDDEALQNVDGLSAIFMALAVVGLMSAINDALQQSPGYLFSLLLLAFVVNIGLQLICWYCWRGFDTSSQQIGPDRGQVETTNAIQEASSTRIPLADYRVPVSVIAGNRNIALYLTALPAAVTEPLLAFIGCYQFPMYLTPLLMNRLYKR